MDRQDYDVIGFATRAYYTNSIPKSHKRFQTA